MITIKNETTQRVKKVEFKISVAYDEKMTDEEIGTEMMSELQGASASFFGVTDTPQVQLRSISSAREISKEGLFISEMYELTFTWDS